MHESARHYSSPGKNIYVYKGLSTSIVSAAWTWNTQVINVKESACGLLQYSVIARDSQRASRWRSYQTFTFSPPLPPWRAQGKGDYLYFVLIKTSGDNGHPRRSPLKADPKSVSISPPSESSEAGAFGGLLGRGWLLGRGGLLARGSTKKIPWYAPYGVDVINVYIRLCTVSIGNLLDMLVFITAGAETFFLVTSLVPGVTCGALEVNTGALAEATGARVGSLLVTWVYVLGLTSFATSRTTAARACWKVPPL
ncbi:hypothetical protein ElyMa_006371200 [Elysia marginata]|uniref:Uncharacterized protein n=1 Tax=Elysia marginata TaxID=1093978 RepID=A0AAV4HNQ8_9GAST|nr:hypothetical protein ElyMa_006371200 [Elysia marginata]